MAACPRPRRPRSPLASARGLRSPSRSCATEVLEFLAETYTVAPLADLIAELAAAPAALARCLPAWTAGLVEVWPDPLRPGSTR